MTKIALVGTAPSSRMLAPYNDRSWEIWACSPGNADVLPRVDAFFEFHSIAVLEKDSTWTPFLSWLCMQPRVYLQALDPRFKGAIAFPKDEMIEKFGPYFFSSSLAWMAALAIDNKPEAIGFWGVDMTANDEYGYQRAACQHFIQLARERGIEVIVPPESDLDRPLGLYGYRELSLMWQKLKLKDNEYAARIQHLDQIIDNAEKERMGLHCGRDVLDYVMQTWTGEDNGALPIHRRSRAQGQGVGRGTEREHNRSGGQETNLQEGRPAGRGNGQADDRTAGEKPALSASRADVFKEGRSG